MKSTTGIIGLICIVVGAAGCNGSAAPTKAPPITGHRKEWKEMNKDEKIALIQKQPIPDGAKQDEIKKINSGQD